MALDTVIALQRLFTAGSVAAAAMAVSPEAAPPPEFVTGNDIYAECTSKVTSPTAPSAVDHAFCGAYVVAIFDTLSEGNKINGWSAPCPPRQGNGVTLQKMVDVVTRYLGAHPETRQFGAPGQVAHALAEAFPCK
jgi:hypothetical protein